MTGLGARILSLGLGVVVNIVLVRSLTAASFGQFTYALAIAGIASQLADSGIVQAVTRLAASDNSRSHDVAAVAATLRLALGSFLGGLGFCIGIAIASSLAPSTLAVLLLPVPLGFVNVYVAVANAELRPHLGPILVLIQSAMWTATAVLIAYIAPSPRNFAIGLSATSILQVVSTIWTLALRRFRLTFNAQVATEIIKLSWAPALLGLLVTSYYRLDTIVIYRLVDSEALGFYGAAYRFLDTAQVLPTVLVAPLVPLVVSAERGGTGQSRSIAALGERYAMLSGTLVATVLIGCGGWLLRVFYGARYADAATGVLAWLGVAFVGVSLGYVGTSVAMGLGSTRVQIAPVALLAVGSVGSQIVLIPMYGIICAAVITAATELAMSAIGLFIVHKHIGARFNAAYGLRCIAVCAVASAAGNAVRGSLWSVPVSIFVFIGLALAAQLLSKSDIRLIFGRA